jgi:hypothetical protein
MNSLDFGVSTSLAHRVLLIWRSFRALTLLLWTQGSAKLHPGLSSRTPSAFQDL